MLVTHGMVNEARLEDGLRHVPPVFAPATNDVNRVDADGEWETNKNDGNIQL